MENFQPSGSFQGYRKGWVFQMGQKGLGYYHDKLDPPSTGAIQIDIALPSAPAPDATPKDASEAVTSTLPPGVQWRVVYLRIGEKGAGLDLEHTEFGFLVASVSSNPGQDLTKGDVIVGMANRNLQKLTEPQLHASFQKRCKKGMQLVVCRLDDLEKAKKLLPDKDGILEGIDANTGATYFFNVRTGKSAWTREEAVGFKHQDQLSAFLIGGSAKEQAPKKKKRKVQEKTFAEHAQEINARYADWNKDGRVRSFDIDIYSCLNSIMGMWDIKGLKAGVVTGDVAWEVIKYAKANKFAIPAFNVSSSSTIVAVLEAAKDINSPIMIQMSQGGSQFIAGKGLPNKDHGASILGAITGAHIVRDLAAAYGIPVILHSDHCAKKLLPWFDGMLDADEAYFAKHGEPLFSSHMLDLSEECHEENIGLCVKYFTRMAKMNLILEMEIGITGGEEDGVDNSNVAADKLYTTPEEVYMVHEALAPISEKFTIAAAFGNVHGVYKPGNVKLRPELLGDYQKYAAEKVGSSMPLFLVFHGGSGSTAEEIATAVSNGVIKMNVDTDTQWAYWEGVLNFYKKKSEYLQGQIGNPDGPEKPNKSNYDPRKWIREGEISMSTRVKQACEELGNKNTLA